MFAILAFPGPAPLSGVGHRCMFMSSASSSTGSELARCLFSPAFVSPWVKRRVPLLLAFLLLTGWVLAASKPQQMPACPEGQPASTHAPLAPPSLRSPLACRARASLVQRSAAIPLPGYHHLGAT